VNAQEFGQCVDKLRSAYGTDKYPEVRVRVFLREFGRMEFADFDAICDEMIANHQYVPPIEKFREFSKTYFAKYAEERKRKYEAWLDSQPYCRHCDMSGVLYGKHLKSGNKCAFRCPCIVGQRAQRYGTFPEWNAVEFGDTHEVEYFAPEGFDRRTAKQVTDQEIGAIIGKLSRGFNKSMKEIIAEETL